MKLSIITINFNNASGLKRTIESVKKQTFSDYEYIVIDGGSTDNSVSIIKEYTDCISNWVSEKDNGIYNAMNKGITLSKGEYCLFLNSGDYLCNSDVLYIVCKSGLKKDIVYGDIISIENEKKKLHRYPDKLTPKYFFNYSLGHPSSFIKRDLLIRLRMYDENIKISADHEFFLKAICANSASYVHVPLPISVFEVGGISSNGQTKDQIRKEKNESFKKYFPLFYEDYKYEYLFHSNKAVKIVEKHMSKKSLLLLLRIYNKIVGIKGIFSKIYISKKHSKNNEIIS